MLTVKKNWAEPLPGKCVVVVKTAGEAPVTVETIDGEGFATILSVAPFNTTIRERVDAVEIRASSPKPFGFDLQVRALQEDEPRNEDPVPEPASVNNYLAMIREKVRREMGVTRESFDNDTGLPGYELEDDDPGLFEEEMAEQMASSSSQQNPAPKEMASESDGEPPSGASAPEAQG